MTETPGVFVAIPTHDGRVHCQTMAGCLQALQSPEVLVQIDQMGGSFLPILRDKLTRRFLDSPATHMLCVDSDIGWGVEHLLKLLAVGRDFVSGVYCKKQENLEIPVKTTGVTDGPLAECEYVPGGFMLVTRECVERMVGRYRDLAYNTELGTTWALWLPTLEHPTGYDGEDVAFCRRWRKMGGSIWMHSGVVVDHYGERRYSPLMKLQ